MDIRKRLIDLMNRAEQTTFENEMKTCLTKIKAILAKFSISDINAFINEQEEIHDDEFPIVEIRNIFIRQFYPYYCEDTVIDVIDNVPVAIDKYTIEYLKSRCDNEVIQFAKCAPSLANVYKKFLNFIERKLEDIETKHKVLMCGSYDNFIIVPREIAYWINDKINYIDIEPGTIEEVCQQRVKSFLARKEEFINHLNRGHYDDDIRRVIDVKALPSSEKVVSYSISDHMDSKLCNKNTNKKSTKKKPKTNWYVDIHNK